MYTQTPMWPDEDTLPRASAALQALVDAEGDDIIALEDGTLVRGEAPFPTVAWLEHHRPPITR